MGGGGEDEREEEKRQREWEEGGSNERRGMERGEDTRKREKGKIKGIEKLEYK